MKSKYPTYTIQKLHQVFQKKVARFRFLKIFEKRKQLLSNFWFFKNFTQMMRLES